MFIASEKQLIFNSFSCFCKTFIRIVLGFPFGVFVFLIDSKNASGILPVNAHGEVNILNLNSIDSFIFYSSTTRLSNSIHYN